ncbi:ankyrin repeat and LEM domain-containing protein 1 [Corvus moneduloides]|uniref:ankyrin repeat and LEM domain-containing protein 1 n=1 Tax=Corvus moneduloides TaxID=1196302 RepID=UPI001363917A|nr:ankyrin repeat and LEM domain-containing protein 1 [Corvus moneduloides]
MPRRPPRLRVPRAAVTSPLGRCVPPGDGDVAAGEAEGTGGSWGDTQILPGLSPGGGSAPKSGPTVLLGFGDKGHPRNSSGSGPTVLLGSGDKGHPQNSSGSGPTVLLGFGDKGHPQDSLSLARGSPKPSPKVRLVTGTRGHPQKFPSVTRGPLGATGMLEGGSGWQQRPSPLGTSRSRWPHGSLKHPLAPRPPGSASGELGTPSVPPSPGEELGTPSVPPSPGGELGTPSVPPSPGEELGTPSVPPSPAGCATPRSEEHREDVARAQTPAGCHSPGYTDATSSPEGGTGRGGGVPAVAPLSLSVTGQTRPLHRRRLERPARGHRPGWPEGHSPELVAALRTGHIPDCAQDELALTREFERPERGRPWREGRLKSSFNYLLLDPRVTRDLPRRSPGLSAAERFRSFVGAVFYVGKGTRGRACWHLRQALAQLRRGTARGCPKVRRILEIWALGHGVVPLLCFQHRVPAEAFTRESCMLEALGLQPLTNARRGPCYGVAAAWAAERRRRLGVLLLHRAMGVLLAEGERQLRPEDIAGGR